MYLLGPPWRRQSETTIECPGKIAEIGKFSVFFETLVVIVP